MALRVLIVEDNLDWEIIWKLIFDIFAHEAELIWATSIFEAQNKLADIKEKGQRMDIIISDVFLSGSLTGLDFYNAIDETYQARFLFVSSVSPSKIKSQIKKDNRHVFVLKKPFGIKQAIAELRAIQRLTASSNATSEIQKETATTEGGL
jgi:DNA-binding response OmpR family regulator